MKMIRDLAAMLVLCSGLLTCGTPALASEKFVVGDLVTSGSYCIGEDTELMMGLIAFMERDGMMAYNLIMRNPELSCYDAQMHQGAGKATAKLVEELGDFTIADSITLTLWKVQDGGGAFGYMWTEPNDGGT